MDITARQFMQGFVFILGLVLIVGGIASDTNGALIVGLVVAAVSFQEWQKWDKQ